MSSEFEWKRCVTKAWRQLEKFHSSLEKQAEIGQKEKHCSPTHGEPDS